MQNQTLYDMLALALNLKKVEDDELSRKFTAIFEGDKVNIPVLLYEDKYGNRLYRDKYGFHSVNQLINVNLGIISRLENIKRKQMMVDKYKGLMSDVLTKKTKQMLRIIINSNHLTQEEKLEHIKTYINTK